MEMEIPTTIFLLSVYEEEGNNKDDLCSDDKLNNRHKFLPVAAKEIILNVKTSGS